MGEFIPALFLCQKTHILIWAKGRVGTINDIQRLPDETEYSYIWRLGEAKTQGTLDLTWDEIASLINKEFREEGEPYRTESSYRKQYQISKLFFDNVFSRLLEEVETEDLFREQKDELFKLKKQFYDQRREYNKLLTADARWEHLVGEVKNTALALNKIAPLLGEAVIGETEDSEGLLMLSDWHYGMVTDNIWNRYNVEIFKKRLNKLRNKVIQYAIRHKPKVMHVAVLGDMVQGAIHVTSRVNSEEITVEQIMHVSEYIAELVADIAKYVPSVKVYSTYGNHARTVQNYKDSVHSDNLERLIPWWLTQRLVACDGVEVMDNDKYEFIHIPIYDSNIVGSHGDLESKKNPQITISQLFAKKYGINIDTVIGGHIHHNTADEDLGVEYITGGSMCGTDDFSNNGRMFSIPSQTLLFYSEDSVGKECRYDITFSDGKD